MPVITTLVGSKIALGVVALIALGGGGLTIAAAASTLPDLVVAETPAPTEDADDEGTDEGTDGESEEADGTEDGTEDGEETGGPDATGPAGFGLCTAYFAGGLPPVSTAYLSLSTAAGEGGIDAFCAVVVADKKGVSDEVTDGTEDGTETDATTHGKSGEQHGKPATSHKGGNGGGHGHH